MAVTMLEGFDLAHYAPGSTPINNLNPYWAYAGRAGGFALSTGIQQSAGGEVGLQIPTKITTPDGVCAGALKLQPSFIQVSPTHDFFRVSEGSVNHLTLRRASDQTIQLLRGDGTVLGTSTAVWTDPTVWTHFGIEFLINDTTGHATVYMAGKQIISVSGVDTMNGGSTGIVDSMTVLAFATAGNANGNGYGVILDDFYAVDTTGTTKGFLGDCVVESKYPVSDGDSAQWTPSTGTAHWSTLDDTSSTDYVGTSTVGAQDLYGIADGSAAFAGVFAVQLDALVFSSGTGAVPGTNLNAVMKGDGGTVVSDVAVPVVSMSATPTWVSGAVHNVDPDGDPWTLTNFNALQAGVSLT